MTYSKDALKNSPIYKTFTTAAPHKKAYCKNPREFIKRQAHDRCSTNVNKLLRIINKSYPGYSYAQLSDLLLNLIGLDDSKIAPLVRKTEKPTLSHEKTNDCHTRCRFLG